MKIYAFEVRDDEKEYFRSLAKKTESEIILDPDGLTPGRIPELEPGCGVSSLGMYRYGETELDLLKMQGVR